MAPSTNKTYRIRSHSGSGKYLNVYGNDQVSANRNVCLWSLDTSAKAQQWNVLQVIFYIDFIGHQQDITWKKAYEQM